MFNLNKDNHIVTAQHHTDMRMGMNGMCGQVRKVGREPANGDVYIFVGKSHTTMKLLHWERGGDVMYYKCLEQGRFHPRILLRLGIGFRSMRWDEHALLMEEMFESYFLPFKRNKFHLLHYPFVIIFIKIIKLLLIVTVI